MSNKNSSRTDPWIDDTQDPLCEDDDSFSDYADNQGDDDDDFDELTEEDRLRLRRLRQGLPLPGPRNGRDFS